MIVSDVDDLLAQLGPRRGNDRAELHEALSRLWEIFWASKKVAPGHPAHLWEWHSLCIDFIRDWDA